MKTLSRMAHWLVRGREEGATMVEYALMVFLIAIACIVAVTALGTSLNNVYNAITAAI